MAKLAEINKKTGQAYNEQIARQIREGEAYFLRSIKGWEFLNLAPYNFKSGKAYEGQNFIFLLPLALHYQNGAFLTFKQIKEFDGMVNEGETASSIVFWSFNEKSKDEAKALAPSANMETAKNLPTTKESKEKKVTYAFLKRYNVFNLAQTTMAQIPTKTPPREKTDEAREAIFKFAEANKSILKDPKGDGLDFNRFLVAYGYQRAIKDEINSQTSWASWDKARGAMTGELVNLLISARIGADFSPIATDYQEKWAQLIEDDMLDFLKVAKHAKKIADEMMEWQNLDKIEGEIIEDKLTA